MHSVAFAPDGKRVVSGSGDSLVKIWNAETGVEVSSLKMVRWWGFFASVWCKFFLGRYLR
jgi:WD40 repeat protein